MLTVVRCVGKKEGKWGYFWECQCTCGNRIERRVAVLRDGSCTNCGCMTRIKQSKARTVHGKSKTREFRIWTGMKVRCSNENDRAFPDYGGRGISVCSQWLGKNGFAQFLADMGECPPDKHSIERKDNDGNYEPGNCKWATREEQNSNTRRTRKVTHEGQTKTISQWAREFGISRCLLRARLEMGWEFTRAVTEPVHTK